MDVFKVLSAFYIKEKDELLVCVQGRDARLKGGTAICDAFGRKYKIEALAQIGGVSPENEEKFTSFLIKGRADIGRLIRILDAEE